MKHVNESGRSMVEMLGVLAIIGVLSVGGIAGYSKAMSKYKVNKTIDQVTTLVANIRTTFASQSKYGTSASDDFNNAKAVEYGVLPNDMYTKTGDTVTVTNPYAGGVTIASSAATANNDYSAFTITYEAVPKDACRTILTSDWGSDLGSGLIAVASATAESGDITAPDVSEVYVGGTGENESDGGVIGVPGGSAQSLPLTLSEAVTACGENNTITWKYY